MQSLLLEEGVQAVLLLFLKVQKRTWKGGINNISMIQRFFILTMHFGTMLAKFGFGLFPRPILR